MRFLIRAVMVEILSIFKQRLEIEAGYVDQQQWGQ